MVRCPHCGREAMSHFQKSALGPGRVVACKSCGKRITTHWSGILAAVPAFAGGWAFLQTDSFALGMGAILGGLLLMGLLHAYVVPLVKAGA
ncbi:MAG: hypothetical protein ABI585_09840 [Betaproteobacteria bacterium]